MLATSGNRFVTFAAIVLLAASAAVAGCALARSDCAITSDCPMGQYCTPTGCQFDCRNDFDCTSGQHCIAAIGKCVSDGGVDGDMAVSQPRDMAAAMHDFADNSQPDLSVSQPLDFATSTSPDLAKPMTGGAYGDSCDPVPQPSPTCMSGLCSRNRFVSVEAECTKACASASDCAIGHTCVNVGPPYNGQCTQLDIGFTCTNGNECRTGLCLGVAPAPKVCTQFCSSAADCPAGWGCSLVATNPNQFACIPLDTQPSCAASANCWYGALCDTGNQRCLSLCRGDADCPLEHFCQSNLCVPNTQGKASKGQGVSCVGGDECRSGYCAGVCVDACGVTKDKGQWCQNGAGCIPQDDGAGNTVLVCMPSGTGLVGDACADETDCISGVCWKNRCSKFCNSAPCPSARPSCVPSTITASGIPLRVCQ